jgi:effector-binding domain-containing protein
MNYVVEYVDVAAVPLAVVRRTIERANISNEVIPALTEVYGFLEETELGPCGHNVMVYLDNAINMEIGVQVPRAFESDSEVRPSASPAGPALFTRHIGPYGELGAAHSAVQRWAREQGVRLNGVCWEVYGDWAEDPAKLETDVFYLITS